MFLLKSEEGKDELQVSSQEYGEFSAALSSQIWLENALDPTSSEEEREDVS